MNTQLQAPARRHLRQRRRVARSSAVLAVSVVSAVGVFGMAAAPATAAPGSPGVPAAPTALDLEDFQHVANPSQTDLLATYVSATGATYTADPYWLNPNYCNGIVTSFVTSSPECTASNAIGDVADRNIRRLAYVLGQVHGDADPASNFALSAWTTEPFIGAGPLPPVGSVEFATTTPWMLNLSGRYISASIDVAEASCAYLGGANNSRLSIAIVDGAVEHQLTANDIVPCQDANAQTYTDAPLIDGLPYGDGGEGVRAGTYYSDSSYLFTGSALGIVVRNNTGQLQGNDYAIDNLQMIDVTPQLDKAFSTPSAEPGAAVTLTFTVTNRSDLGAKLGWSATDSLPTGMTVAASANASTDCTNGVIDAVAGAATVSIAGDLVSGQTSCTFSVDVTAPAGSYQNCAANITAAVGLDRPGCALVEFVDTTTTTASPTTTSVAVEAPTTTSTSTSTTVGPSTTPRPPQPPIVTRPLPATGASTTPLLAVAAGVGGIGCLMIVLARRRRNHSAHSSH